MVWEGRTTGNAVWPRYHNGVLAEGVVDLEDSGEEGHRGNGVTAMKRHRHPKAFAGGIAVNEKFLVVLIHREKLLRDFDLHTSGSFSCMIPQPAGVYETAIRQL